MTNAQKITVLIGAIGFQVSRIEYVRMALVTKGSDVMRFAEPAEEVLEKALKDLTTIANGMGDFMNDTDLIDDDDVAMLTPAFDMMNESAQ